MRRIKSNEIYSHEEKLMYNKGLRQGYQEGVRVQQIIFNDRINTLLKKIDGIKEEFTAYRISSEDKGEEKVWIDEIAALIKQERLLRSLKEE
jgi:hypothetical protein